MKRRDYLKLAAGLPAIATSKAMAVPAKNSGAKPNETVNFSANIPVRYNVDVFVAGGGPAGIAAMVAAAESGADVYAAENLSCFGPGSAFHANDGRDKFSRRGIRVEGEGCSQFAKIF